MDKKKLVIGGIIVAGILGLVLYLKRKSKPDHTAPLKPPTPPTPPPPPKPLTKDDAYLNIENILQKQTLDYCKSVSESPKKYLQKYPDVAASPEYKDNPYQHWLLFGKAEGRVWEGFPPTPESKGICNDINAATLNAFNKIQPKLDKLTLEEIIFYQNEILDKMGWYTSDSDIQKYLNNLSFSDYQKVTNFIKNKLGG